MEFRRYARQALHFYVNFLASMQLLLSFSQFFFVLSAEYGKAATYTGFHVQPHRF